MKSHLKVHHIPSHTPEWYEFRKNGIGGSEVGTVLGLNDYTSAVILYYEKLGLRDPRKEQNEPMFWGSQLEDEIAEKWQYWDGTTEGMIAHYNNNSIVRQCRKVNGYITNPKYPHLFASVDRLMNISGGFRMDEGRAGEALTEEGILECKQLSHWAAQKWESGVPIYYLTQVQDYQMILETDYAEIAILKDGNKFECFPVPASESTQQYILNHTTDFWYNRIVPAKEAVEQFRLGNMSEQEMDTIVQKYEPEPDSTEAYKEFVSEKFKKEREEMFAEHSHVRLIEQYVGLREAKKLIEEQYDTIGNTLRNIFRKEQVEFIKSTDGHKARFYARKGASQPTLDVRWNGSNTEAKKVEDKLIKAGIL